MTQRAVNNPDDLKLLHVYLDQRKRPFTVEITDGRDRTTEQNNLAFRWYSEIAAQSGEDVEDVRARCKLEIGVPILRRALETFRKTYDASIRDLSYERKLAIIRDMDVPVTRLMNVTQMTAYMDEVFRRHAAFGIALTIPEDKFAFSPKQARAA